jgi:hypothetical protein
VDVCMHLVSVMVSRERIIPNINAWQWQDHGGMKVFHEVEVASFVKGSANGGDDFETPEAAAETSSSAAYISCKRRFLLLLLLILSLVLSTMLLVETTTTTFNVRVGGSKIRRRSDNDSKIILHDGEYFLWVKNKLRWQPARTIGTTTAVNDNNCNPRFRLANATIHCGFAGISPLTNASGTDGRRLCGGVPMEPNYCVLPSQGSWISAATSILSSTEELPSKFPPLTLPRRLGMNNINNDTTMLPRCKTIEEFTNGTYEGAGFDLEWVPNNCSSIPLSPFVWTRNTHCQATITMIVSIILRIP